MERITIKHLHALCDRLNKVTGSPMTYAQPFEPGKPFCSNIGNYHIDRAYGGYMLARVSNTAGGISYPIAHSHVPSRELYNLIHAYLKGFEHAASRG